MKRLSIVLPAMMLALVLTLSGAALTPIAKASGSVSSSVVAGSSAAGSTAVVARGLSAARQIYYYWYTADDTYNDYNDEDDEMWEWEMWLGGVSINDDPVGGTLIASGYFNNTYPHNNFPVVFIYAHYIY